MKLLILPLMALMISVAFCNSAELLSNKTADLDTAINAYSDYLKVVLPFNLGLNLTDTEELITLNVGVNGTEVIEGIANSSLSCKLSSGLLETLFNSGSIEGVKSALDNEPVSCFSNGAKGEIIISALNGILGKDYIILENKGLLGQIFSAISGFFNWILAFFK
jgi:hypothetical protein